MRRKHKISVPQIAAAMRPDQWRMALIAVVCVLAVLYGYMSLLAAPLRQRTEGLRRQGRELRTTLERFPPPGDIGARERRIVALRDAVQRRREVLDAAGGKMATGRDVARLVKTLVLTAAPDRFELVALRRRPPVRRELYVVQPFEVVFQADYRAVIDYLGCFSGGDKWYVIDRLRILSRPEILPRVEVELGIHNVMLDADPGPAGDGET
ncbi:MAG: hypothetical protein JW781_03280 [Deltaproteobacteria bacterium]|nr:hypothetical protein [Candidatus Anaeroferrophillacea bacterium]